MNAFLDKLTAKWKEDKFVCIGLDSAEIAKSVVDQTHDLVCCYKLNTAFYEEKGSAGWQTLKEIIQYIHQKYPNIPVILDAKRADVENTNVSYAKAVFDELGADAVTINPYLGKEALQPFLKRADKGIFILVKTSNPGAAEIQDLMVQPTNVPLYQAVAQNVASEWNNNGNCGVVVGATHPEELKKVREIVGDMPILIPGVGAQGGDVAQTVKNGLNSQGEGIIISSSRGIIFADDPRAATLKLDQEIKAALKNG